MSYKCDECNQVFGSLAAVEAHSPCATIARLERELAAARECVAALPEMLERLRAVYDNAEWSISEAELDEWTAALERYDEARKNQ